MKTIFEKIISREIPANIIYEDDRVIAFLDVKPVQEGHFLVVPKNKANDLVEQNEDDYLYLMKKARELAKEFVLDKGITGFKMQSNIGSSAGQEVFHTHIHIIPYK
ncbi:histidine triad protein HinT [Mycoplasma sp. Ms02]|uniref:histidine triad protein HinT n=1 Tax=Mycoplasma sp. Ms02 TaxID=353851 RepID=UPI001C893280|nr:HIT family protein [Mycoplasma sp. Ms02]QZE12115.1 HIT family protein [Mycoplasma sp. Ms02]